MGDTMIRWTDKTWNPVTGCSRVSPGCEHCYAEALSLRFGHSKLPWTANHAKDNVVLHPDRLGDPLRWRKPSRVFVNSMSDLFHEEIPDEFIDKVFGLMQVTPQHTYQILTKRPQRMVDYFGACYNDWSDRADKVYEASRAFGYMAQEWPLPNVWLGVSVEDQRRADERIPLLLQVPAWLRFLSCEPLLGPLDLSSFRYAWPTEERETIQGNAFTALDDLGEGVEWVIVGGESGPKFRTMDLDWARSIRDQCVAAGVPFFFKQSSGFRTEMGQELDGVRWEQFPVE